MLRRAPVASRYAIGRVRAGLAWLPSRRWAWTPRLGSGPTRELAGLGIAVKVVTGDNPAVAMKVCRDLGLGRGAALTRVDLGALDDDALAAAISTATVFARVSPEDKARIVRVQRRSSGGVAFLGDGVNDALALHAADIGISVDSGTDVAEDAADVIPLEKDHDVLADGVAEGRRIFANTIKYVLMGTYSNFGNMFSAAGASLFLSFLPMLPSQIRSFRWISNPPTVALSPRPARSVHHPSTVDRSQARAACSQLFAIWLTCLAAVSNRREARTPRCRGNLPA
jgi:magnesium-transporting ATPase (P-type)